MNTTTIMTGLSILVLGVAQAMLAWSANLRIKRLERKLMLLAVQLDLVELHSLTLRAKMNMKDEDTTATKEEKKDDAK